LYKTHLWLGIVSGIVLFIVCLTGTLLVFEHDIKHFLARDKYISRPNMPLLNINDLITKVEQDTNGKIAILIMGINADRANTTVYKANIKIQDKKNTGTNNEFIHKGYIIDPYTGESFENIPDQSEKRLNSIINILEGLHVSLFLPSPIGEFIVGSATLIFVIIALSGLCLWLPANFRNKKAWFNGFLIRFRKGKSQLIFDLHKTLGFYALIPVLLMALTGLAWSFNWYSNGIQMIFNAKPYSNPRCKSLPQSPDAKPLPLGFFYKKADELLGVNTGGRRNFYTPDSEDDSVLVMDYMDYSIGMFKLTAHSRIQFDQYTGEVLRLERFDDLPIGKKIVFLFPTLHYGSVFGLPTKIIYFIAGLIATTLPVTGVIIWWRKLRNLRKTKNNQRKSAKSAD
jgi:uncharacterized iron-regulated membrane protein